MKWVCCMHFKSEKLMLQVNKKSKFEKLLLSSNCYVVRKERLSILNGVT